MSTRKVILNVDCKISIDMGEGVDIPEKIRKLIEEKLIDVIEKIGK